MFLPVSGTASGFLTGAPDTQMETSYSVRIRGTESNIVLNLEPVSSSWQAQHLPLHSWSKAAERSIVHDCDRLNSLFLLLSGMTMSLTDNPSLVLSSRYSKLVPPPSSTHNIESFLLNRCPHLLQEENWDHNYGHNYGSTIHLILGMHLYLYHRHFLSSSHYISCPSCTPGQPLHLVLDPFPSVIRRLKFLLP